VARAVLWKNNGVVDTGFLKSKFLSTVNATPAVRYSPRASGLPLSSGLVGKCIAQNIVLWAVV
jgi:hypothetical protein